MATRTRDNMPARERDKRQAPPSLLPQTGTIQHPRRHPNPSKITTFAQNQDSTASQRQIPTHLKSTKTPTTNIAKQQSKRPTPGDNAHKPTPIRRSTFDDPSSPSTTQNTHVSPNPTLRPSSFSSKTATTPKTGPTRKPSSQYTRPVGSVKKRFIYVKKQDIGTSTAATTKEQFTRPPEKVEVSNAYDVPQLELNPKDQESSINEAKEEALQVGSSTDEAKADVFVHEDPEPICNAQTKAENDKDVNPKTSESSTVSEQQDVTLVVKTEATEDDSQVPETVSNNQEFSEEHNINEVNSSKTDESVADIPEVEEMSKEPARTVSDKKEAEGTESEVRESKETEAQEVGREEKREIVKVAAKTQVPKGKKESVVSNDVIEETASKLREQRKNKVKALAGAFETVISLQEQK